MSEEGKPGFRGMLFLTGCLYLVANLLLLALGGAWGWLLHRVWPAIETGTGVLIGVFVTGFSLYLLLKVFGALWRDAVVPTTVLEEREEEDEEPLGFNPPRSRRRGKTHRRW